MNEKMLKEMERHLNDCECITIVAKGKTYKFDINGCMVDVIGDEQALVHLNVHCDEEETV